MRSLIGLSGIAVALVVLCGGAIAAETAAPGAAPPIPSPAAPPGDTAEAAAWQSVITGQIEAFRKGDAPTALSYAGESFQKTFTDPAMFMMSIGASGYLPIFTSISHSFGRFDRLDDKTVVQEVRFIGAKQELYEATYALTKEAGGWRVQGVELMKQPGMGV